MCRFEDIEVGQRREIGSSTFTAEAIRKFAERFDPQLFHLDEEEGRKSLFGGLAASGWHVGSACMRLIVEDADRLAEEAAIRFEEFAHWDVSPGFRELRWIKPVLAGDTITFFREVLDKRLSMSPPALGSLQVRTTGINQRAEEVFTIRSNVSVSLHGTGG
ncbi:acyl dehydratase [Bradyrhizobium macuxiense]|uniref:Acyl dehydratase n=1 Tax=Bradyrhizobium macuxiense TaxID=1755647 RepID=A0A560KX11_9BRAD|nr:MaoC family dehydratase [Bradyrhizobium macuxiense]TWB87773.1 acyl dehydratase [Bradyrhizobium macuxiense]